MYTSYYSKLDANEEAHPELKAICISNTQPKYINIPKYIPLIPTWDMVNIMRDTGIFDTYIIGVLNNLNPEKVLKELGDNTILYCWEGRDKPCHRHAVADWLTAHGIPTKELIL